MLKNDQVSKPLTPTPVKTGSYQAKAGEMVLVDASGGTNIVIAVPVVVAGVGSPDNRKQFGVKVVATGHGSLSLSLATGGFLDDPYLPTAIRGAYVEYTFDSAANGGVGQWYRTAQASLPLHQFSVSPDADGPGFKAVPGTTHLIGPDPAPLTFNLPSQANVGERVGFKLQSNSTGVVTVQAGSGGTIDGSVAANVTLTRPYEYLELEKGFNINEWFVVHPNEAGLHVSFTATNAAYAIPLGYKAVGAWIRPGAGGGAGGGGGAPGNTAASTAGGGSGGSGHPGMSCILTYVPLTAAPGDVLNIQIGAGGTGGAGGVSGGSTPTPGALGGDTTITNTTTSTVLVQATCNVTLGWKASTGAANATTRTGGTTDETGGSLPARWPDRSGAFTIASGSPAGCVGAPGVNGGLAGADGTAAAARSDGFNSLKTFGPYPHFTPPPAGAAGTFSGTGGGGGGGRGGGSALDGDSGVFFGAAPLTGPGSGRGGIPGAGGNGSTAGVGLPGAPGGAGQTGSAGRGGGGGASGAGGGGGGTGGGAGGTGGAGGKGSDGAVVLVLDRV